jgi:hypothetical protein
MRSDKALIRIAPLASSLTLAGALLSIIVIASDKAAAAAVGGFHGSFHAMSVSSGPRNVVRGSRQTLVQGNIGRTTGKAWSGNTGGKGQQASTGGNSSGGDGRKPPRPHHPRPTGPIGPIGTGVVIGVPVGTGVGVAQPVISGGGHQTPSGQGPQLVRRTNSGVPPAGERRYVPDEVVIEVANTMSDQVADTLARRYRLTRLQSLNMQLSGTTFLRWKITDRRSVPTVVRTLETETSVISVQPNYLALLQDSKMGGATGEGDPAQYALAKLNLPQAHGLATGEKVLIAVIDSGIDAAHPELAGVIAGSFDALGSNEKAHPHGTAIAGAIVAHARLIGAAPAAQILAARAFGAKRNSAEGTSTSILTALDWATANGARVINMSFAGPEDPAVARNLAIAYDKGIILVAAAGNAGPMSRPLYPAADRNVIAVTATDANDNLFPAANRGRHIAVAAPGVDILLPAPGATYQVTSGTSFAAAEVSGAIALMLERKPDLDPATARQILIETAKDLGPRGYDPMFGAGLVDAYRAILSVQPAAIGAASRGTTTGRGQ